MGILLDPTPADKTWGSGIEPAIRAVTKLIAQDYVEAGFKLHEAIKGIRVADEKIEQRAWTLWRESLALTLGEFFKTAALTRQPANAEELQRLLDELLEGSAAIVQQELLELTARDLRRPTDFRLYQNVRDKLSGWARQVAPEHLRDNEHLRRRLDRAFVKGFHRAWFDGGEHFEPIYVYLTGEGSIAIEREELWLRYYEGLREEVEDQPLFGQKIGGPSLADIFVPLRCSWHEHEQKGQGGPPDGRGDEKQMTVRVRWLEAALKNWLKAQDREDPLRIVTGGPGSGKSSSAKIFAWDVAQTDSHNVLFVPLQGLDVSQDIPSIVDVYIADASLGGGCLPENPIGWVREDVKPLVLVFDGLDEVARPDGAGLEVTRQFLGNLRAWLGRANSGGDARVMALVLGRPQAAEDSAKEIGGLAGRPLLYVEPLCPLDKKRLGRDTHSEIEIDDPDDLTKADYRRAFWDGYACFDPHYSGKEPAALAEAGLDDLTIEPLLLYLLMFSGMAGDDWPKAKENRNRIYEAIFRKVHKRDVDKKAATSAKDGIGEDEFFALMECLGLAAWFGGGRTGNDADFERIRDHIYVPELRDSLATLKSAELKNVAVQFYTHRGGQDQPGYAFIHKSFGEYLTGRALVAASAKWCEDYAKRSRWDQFAEDWLRLSGGQHLSAEILRFMVDEARLRLTRGSERKPDHEAARSIVEHLTKAATLALREGFPAHGDLRPSSGQGLLYSGRHWRSREAWQRNAEEALYAVMYAWAEVGYPWELLNADEAEGGWQAGVIKVTWPDNRPTPAAAMLGRLRDPWGGSDLASKLFARWDFSGQRFGQISLSAFALSATDFSGADLAGANLSESILHGADLAGADLSAANLRVTDFNGASLVGATLTDVVAYTTLVSGADLRGAVLSKSGLNGIRGDERTRLPPGFERPPHW